MSGARSYTKQLRKLVGASEAYIRAYESGRRNPKLSSLGKIANALTVNPDGNDIVGIYFDPLGLMRSWFERYEQYMQEVEKCNSIKDVKKRGEALLKAEADFNLWMDVYPESEPFDLNFKIQKTHDEAMDKVGLNSK